MSLKDHILQKTYEGFSLSSQLNGTLLFTLISSTLKRLLIASIEVFFGAL